MAKRKSTRARTTKTNTPRPSALRRLGKWTATLGVWAFILGLFAVGWFYTDLPDVEDSLAPSRRPTVWIMASDGSELAAAGDLYGIPVRLKDLPPSLPQAVLATEDRRFYDHFGIDLIGLARAMVINIRAGYIVQGGSTITQQVAKNLFLSPERTIKRKIQEVMLAFWLENRFSKDQILELYLNRVYLGAGTYGVDAAARKYFGVPAVDLSIWQSAMLAGLLKAPSRYNPHSSDERADARTKVVLSNMVAAGYLSENDAKAAHMKTMAANNIRPGRRAPYFVDWVLDQVRDYVGARDRDLIVKTTLSPTVQYDAEQSLIQTLKGPAKGRNVGDGAVLVMSLDGAVRAMVGGSDYGASQFNRATQASRQPGSAFKPVVYLAGLESGITPSDIISDSPVRIGAWSPGNFDNKYIGDVTMAQGLAKSINTVAVRIALAAGIDRVAKTARALGLDPGDKPDASIALGTAETTLLNITAAYAAFANGGNGIIPFGIEEIRDGGGAIIYRRSGSGLGQVAAPNYIASMNAMMKGVIDGGTGRGAKLDRPAAGKTGTSQNYRDAWFMGYTADYVAGVWLGNDNGAAMKGVTGGSMPARLWQSVMMSAHAGLPPHDLILPGNSDGGGDSDPGFFSRLFATIEDAKKDAVKKLETIQPDATSAPQRGTSAPANDNSLPAGLSDRN